MRAQIKSDTISIFIFINSSQIGRGHVERVAELFNLLYCRVKINMRV